MAGMNDATDLSELAARARRGVSAAELHGAACGLLIVAPEADAALRLVELLGADALTDADAVDAFVSGARYGLSDEGLGFRPLLLDAADGGADVDDFDEDQADGLVEALAQWCAAFVAGLFAGAPHPVSSEELREGALGEELDLGPDAEELIRDLVAIAQVETVLDGADLDEAELAFTELHEFVRVAVLLLAAGGEDRDP